MVSVGLSEMGTAFAKAKELGCQAVRGLSQPATDIRVVKEGYVDQVNPKDRLAEARRILIKYPDRIPVICEQANSSNIMQLDKRKFLVPKDLTMGQFMHVIRSRMKMRSDQALFMFVDGDLPRTDAIMDEVYAQHQNDDGFLYVKYSGENTFG